MMDFKFEEDRMMNLETHGLSDSELERKNEFYEIIRKDYHRKKIIFVKGFIQLMEKIQRLKKGISKVKDLPDDVHKFYEVTRNKLRAFGISKERLLEFLNSFLKSATSVLGFGEIASEYKDSIEIATKKETSVQFNVVVFKSEPKMLSKMKKYILQTS